MWVPPTTLSVGTEDFEVFQAWPVGIRPRVWSETRRLIVDNGEMIQGDRIVLSAVYLEIPYIEVENVRGAADDFDGT